MLFLLVKMKITQLCPLCDPMDFHGILQAKYCSLSFLQGIFPTQGLNTRSPTLQMEAREDYKLVSQKYSVGLRQVQADAGSGKTLAVCKVAAGDSHQGAEGTLHGLIRPMSSLGAEKYHELLGLVPTKPEVQMG